MDCIFCKIANGEIPSDTVYEDENFRVILVYRIIINCYKLHWF